MVDSSLHLDKLKQLQAILNGVLLGKPEVVEMTLVCLLSGGHLLLEDMPGVGKTTLAAALAKAINGTCSRIQFTADLLPSDIIGTRIYRRSDERFEFVPGPVFANFVLADELNRSPPKTQSALLQAMNERIVTVDRETLSLPAPFMVIGTQNPRGYHGTYPLPESQRDRFLMRLSIGYPDYDTEIKILGEHRETDPVSRIEPVTSAGEIFEMQKQIRLIDIPDAGLAYLSRLADASRRNEELAIPISPRGSLALMRAGQALAFIRAKKWVDIDAIKFLAPSVLAHRMSFRSMNSMGGGEGASVAWVQRELLQRVDVE